MNEYLIQGFYEELGKHAGLSREDIRAGAIGLLPFGTTLSTGLGDRPKGHERFREWVGRAFGSVAGAAVGAAALGGVGLGLGRLAARKFYKKGLEDIAKGVKRAEQAGFHPDVIQGEKEIALKMLELEKTFKPVPYLVGGIIPGYLGGSTLGEAYGHKVWGPKKKKYR
jgi:hypothetical protein